MQTETYTFNYFNLHSMIAFLYKQKTKIDANWLRYANCKMNSVADRTRIQKDKLFEDTNFRDL